MLAPRLRGLSLRPPPREVARMSQVQSPPREAGPELRPALPRGRPLVRLLGQYTVLALVAAYFLTAWPFLPELASAGNLTETFGRMLPLLAVALGQMVVMIGGGIDLSVTSVIALASIAGAAVMTQDGGFLAGSPLAAPAAVAAMLLVGAVVGLLNGLAVTLLAMPAFIVTLAMAMALSGLAIWATQSRNIAQLPDSFLALNAGALGLPWACWIVGGLALVTDLLLRRTLPGRWLYAVGMNPRAARISGVPVRRTLLAAYTFCGAAAALAAVLYTARAEHGSPTLGSRILLDVIGAVVIGGTSLFGGAGKVLWTCGGVLLFVLIDNTLELWGVPYELTMIIKGGVILAAAALDGLRRRWLAG